MSHSPLPDGLISFGSDANCTLELCPLDSSILRYQPNIPANAIFIGVFGMSMALHIFQGIKMKTWGFMSSMMAGCILEIVGYVGRLIIHDNPFDFIGFLLQIIFITIAPVFFSAAIYVLLSQVINFVDPNVSRFPPKYFYWIFIPSDIISLILQAVGGAVSVVSTAQDDVKTGEDISIAGLVFQVVTLVCFVALFIDYVIRASKSPARYRLTKPILTFLFFLFLSTIFILIRCGYRIAELNGGYFSAIFRDEGLYIALESCMMCIAVLLLNVGHPGYAFKETPEFTKEMDQMDQDDTTVFGD
ncbi:RTA1 like protein-domain-containing protein [Fusarium redolens]|uniref:RTA1 like protein-domain-containing protein n=1 Tax=Fusarium redolens TaxID=48865 RepID=A0A9P9HWH0_FUSRE|nr:RTA1 like protein-domain-containing protein [Fusarium redolens]KAH7264890.1 RTA1 like protein-domain-containing protein [Fusarium redolens]